VAKIGRLKYITNISYETKKVNKMQDGEVAKTKRVDDV
jgi:hypothetical protein